MGCDVSDIEDNFRDLGSSFDDYMFHGGFEDDIFHGGFEDELRNGLSWIDDEIINPVYEFQKGVFQTFADDILYAVVYVVVAVYAPYLLPYVTAIKTKSDGGTWFDAVVAGYSSYFAGQLGDAPILGSVGEFAGGELTDSLIKAGLDPAMAASFGGVISTATTQGLSQGTVAVVTGGSFSDGFTQGFIGDIVNLGTDKVLGYVESKLPDGFKYKTEVKNEAGQVVDKNGNRVYESIAGSGPNGRDDINKLVTDNGVARKAAEVLETFPPVVQEMLSVSVAAALQGKEVTPEMMYGVIANAYITAQAVGSVMEKIPGVDLSSTEGQNFLRFLTPAIQKSAVQAASMGLTEESGRLTAENILEALELYSVDEIFKDTLDFIEDNEIVQSVYQKLDYFTGVTNATEKASKKADEASKALGEAYDELITMDNQSAALYSEYALAVENYEASGGLAYNRAVKDWQDSFKNGKPIGYPADAGFVGFQDYYEELARVNGYASIAQLEIANKAAKQTGEVFNSHTASVEDRRTYLQNSTKQATYITLTAEEVKTTDAARLETVTNPDGTETFYLLENGRRIENTPAGDLFADFTNSFSDYRSANELQQAEVEDISKDIIENIVPQIQRDLVLANVPTFDEEYYEERYGATFADGASSFQDYVLTGAKEGKFVSQGQADAFEAQAKEQFRLQVAEELSAGNGMGYLANVRSDATAKANFDADVDAMWEANFYDEFDNFQSYKFETLQFLDQDGNPTSEAYSDVPLYRGGFERVQNDYIRKVPDAWSGMATTVATGMNYYDPNEFDFMDAEYARQALTTAALDDFNTAELANILSGGGVAFGQSGRLEFVTAATDGDNKFSMFDPVTGESNYLVDGLSFDYLKEVDNRSYLQTTADLFRAFGDRVGASADAYNADKLVAVEIEQLLADGIVDSTTAVAINIHYINTQATLAIAEGLTNAGMYLIDGAVAQFDPDNPYGLLDWSDEGVTAKFDMWKAAGENLEKTIKQLPQDTVQAGKTTGALALQGVAELGQSFLGMARFMGQNPESLPAYQFLEDMVVLGEDWKSDDWKAGAANLSANLAGRGVDNPNTPENEAIWGTMQVIGGAFADNPIEFLGEIIFREGIQEVVPLVVGGGIGYAAGKGGAKLVQKELSEKFARNLGFAAGVSLDIAESAGGTVESAYQEAFEVIEASLIAKNSETGYSSAQIGIMADHYAQDIAVKNGVYAAMATSALMLAGGAALDKAVFGRVDKDAFIAWGTKLDSALVAAGKTATKEGISEFVEEFAINDHLEGMLYEWDNTRNITGNNWFAGTMGAIIAGPVTGTMAAFMQPNPDAAAIGFTIPDFATASGTRQFASTGNTEADLLIQFNPNIAAAVYNNSATLEDDLAALGVTYETFSALGDAANDPDYTGNPLTTRTEPVRIGYTPTTNTERPDFDTFPESRTGVEEVTTEDGVTKRVFVDVYDKNMHYDPVSNKTYKITRIGYPRDSAQWEEVGEGNTTVEGKVFNKTIDRVVLEDAGDRQTDFFTDPVSGKVYLLEQSKSMVYRRAYTPNGTLPNGNRPAKVPATYIPRQDVILHEWIPNAPSAAQIVQKIESLGSLTGVKIKGGGYQTYDAHYTDPPIVNFMAPGSNWAKAPIPYYLRDEIAATASGLTVDGIEISQLPTFGEYFSSSDIRNVYSDAYGLEGMLEEKERLQRLEDRARPPSVFGNGLTYEQLLATDSGAAGNTLQGLTSTLDALKSALDAAISFQDKDALDAIVPIYAGVYQEFYPHLKEAGVLDGAEYSDDWFGGTIPISISYDAESLVGRGRGFTDTSLYRESGNIYSPEGLEEFDVMDFIEGFHPDGIIPDGNGGFVGVIKDVPPLGDSLSREDIDALSEQVALKNKIYQPLIDEKDATKAELAPYLAEIENAKAERKRTKPWGRASIYSKRNHAEYWDGEIARLERAAAPAQEIFDDANRTYLNFKSRIEQNDLAQERLIDAQNSRASYERKALDYYVYKAVDNGWELNHAYNYVLRNGKDILANMEGFDSEADFDSYFVNNTDVTKTFSGIDATPPLTFNTFKYKMIKEMGLSEDEFYASLGASFGDTREDIDNNLAEYLTNSDITPSDPAIDLYIKGAINTEEEVLAAFRDIRGENYIPTVEEVSRYVGLTFSVGEDGKAAYDNLYEDMVSNITVDEQNALAEAVANGDQVAIDLVDAREDLDATQEAINAAHEAVLEAQRQAIDASDEAAAQEAINAAQEALAAVKEEADLKAKQDALDAAEEASAEAARLLANKQRADEAKALREREEAERARQAAEAARRDSMTPEERQAEDAARAGVLELDINYRQLQAEASRYDALTPAEQAAEDLLDPDVVSAQAAYDADPSDTNKSSLAAAKLRAPHRRSREEFYARNDLQDAEDAVDEIVRVSNLTPEEREAEEVAAAQEVAAAKAAQDAIDKAAEEAAEEARLVREATLLAAAKKAAEDAKLEAERVTALTIATNAAAKKQREEDYQAELTKALAIQSEANAEIAARVAANKLRWAEEDAAKRAERAAAEEKYAQEEAARKEAILATLEAARVAAAEARAAREAAAAQAAQDAADAAEKAREAAAAQEAAAAKAAQDAIDKAAEEAEIAAAEAKAAQDLLDAAEAERLANLTPEEQEEELEEELEEDRVSEITPEERTAEEAAIAFATQQKRIAVEQEFRRVWTSRFGSESGAETYLYDGENAIFSTFSNDVGGIEAFVNANTVTVDDVNAALALAGITDLSAMSDYGETSYGNFTGFKPKSVLQDKVDAFVPILQYTREEAEADLAEELMIPVADIPAEYNQYLTDIVDMSGATTRDMGKYTVQGSVWGKSDVYAIFGYGLYGKDPKDVYSDADAKQFVDQGQYTADLDRYRNGTTARLSQRSIINTMLSSLGYTATDNELDMLSRGIGGRSVANTQDLTTYVAGKSAGNSDTEIFESIETGHNAYLRKLIVDEFSRLEYTPTDADIESMLSSGTGSMGVANYINVNTVTEQEVDTFFNFYAKDFVRGENFDYSEFTGNNPQSELKGNIENYVAPRQYTREEAEADLAAELGLGRPLTTEELIPYEQFLTDIVDMSGTTTDVDGKLALESDIITEQDVRDYLLEIGYDNLAEKDFSLIAGNGLVDLEEATLGYQAANESVDQRNARLLAEQEAAADALKIANEAQDAADAAEKAAADLAAANAAAAVKLADTKLAFNDAFAGYDPTDAEIAAYLDNPDDIADYVASNTISEAEAIAALEATDFVIPEGFDFSDFTGKITEGQLATQISTSLAPLQYTRADAEAALATELGRPLTDDDLVTYSDYLDGLVDMTGATTNVIGDLAVQDDIVTADDVALYLSDLGYDTSNLTAEDLAGFASTGLNIELDTVTSAYQAENDTIAQEEANAAILAAANALNKPAELVTQADLDFVAQMAAANATSELSGQEVSYDVRYDLNNDGVVNYLDNQLLNELYAGEDAQYNTYVQGIDPNSAFANTGVFDTLAYDREQDRLSDIALQEEIDAQAALDAQIAQDLNTQLNIQTQATQDAQRRSLLYALAAEQGDKGKVPEIDTVPFKQRYNWESIFSSEQEELDRGSVTPYSRVAQEQEATSPYGGYEPAKRAAATGGLITDESDELLALLGLE